eukprot:scaffold28547_cov35-Tisochrysis_lutea.AAC.3
MASSSTAGSERSLSVKLESAWTEAGREEVSKEGREEVGSDSTSRDSGVKSERKRASDPCPRGGRSRSPTGRSPRPEESQRWRRAPRTRSQGVWAHRAHSMSGRGPRAEAQLREYEEERETPSLHRYSTSTRAARRASPRREWRTAPVQRRRAPALRPPQGLWWPRLRGEKAREWGREGDGRGDGKR